MVYVEIDNPSFHKETAKFNAWFEYEYTDFQTKIISCRIPFMDQDGGSRADTVKCHYKAVQFITKLHTTLR